MSQTTDAAAKKTAPKKTTAKTAAGKTAAPKNTQRQKLKKELEEKLLQQFSVQPRQATDAHLYNALVLVLRDRMRHPSAGRQAGLLYEHGVFDGSLPQEHSV